ncbi:MAG: hypothetical protein AXW12_01975 [Thalassospira sp. Nap_22]|nr:MAG: hypothetical protein AXW12_01975 [Thalassospira sp. Nap_22]
MIEGGERWFPALFVFCLLLPIFNKEPCDPVAVKCTAWLQIKIKTKKIKDVPSNQATSRDGPARQM